MSTNHHAGEAWLHVPDDEWPLYRAVLERALERGAPFAVGGGFAYSFYAGVWRDTKDLDIYVTPAGRDAMIEIVTEAGFHDYFEQKPYDRGWIYRAVRGEVIIDVIWQMANYRAAVDERWLEGGAEVLTRGLPLRMIAPEELLWAKLYIVQRWRCDWPDVLGIVHALGPTLDWEHLFSRLGEDVALLRSLMSLFAWICPERAFALDPRIWARMGLPPPLSGPPCEENRKRVDLLDSRPWFAPAEKAWHGPDAHHGGPARLGE